MLPILAAGQAVSVIDFMPVAADASTVCEARSLTDASGSPCSVVKVLTDYTDWTFEARLAGIVDVRNENDAICLYIPATARILSFSHPKYGAVRDWTIPQTLLPGYCYSLRLKIRQTPEHAAAGLPDRIPTPGPVPKPVSATTQRVKPEISTRIRRESQFSDHFIDFTGGACPKNAPSGASTPSRVAQKADRALNCGLIGQPGGSLSEKCPFGCFYPFQSSAEGRSSSELRTYRTAWGGSVPQQVAAGMTDTAICRPNGKRANTGSV